MSNRRPPSRPRPETLALAQRRPARPFGAGWREHDGGKSPVGGHFRVDLVFRDGRRSDDGEARRVIWPDAPAEYPKGHKLWGLEPDHYNDVIWWRISPEWRALQLAAAEVRADA